MKGQVRKETLGQLKGTYRMDKTIKAEISGSDALARFWAQYFMETPVCTHPDCGTVAHVVDSFFPYLDDLNRCENHPSENREARRWAARNMGCREMRRGTVPGLRRRVQRLR